ncbi:MAG: hypothetical protein O9297_11370 [Flavobacterium sp.]|jgi:hypothetical protein|uniref:hypothetical protein n=1 Tax=Flavobacterium sp. TaxID=239 RepID=UPI0022C0875F|nr:hypothetical protein [Flavobacterium sp.]MCZ8297804.1 hypothetical protein [Flavobacterium sp.]
MKKQLFIFLVLTMGNSYSQNLTELNINFMLRGNKYVSSSKVDTTALGGYGGSDNLPKKNALEKFNEKGFILRIDTLDTSSIGNKYLAYKLYLINTTEKEIELFASDSRISIIAQALVDGEWKNIEYLPSSSCGNSYHSVFLNPNEYWEFLIPKFKGKLKTKIRYRLILGKDKFIDSNEIYASINKKQLYEKQSYSNNGIMDPYFD